MEGRNKTYVCFDAEDAPMYELMQTWDENDNFDFNFYDACDLDESCPEDEEEMRRIISKKMVDAKVLVVLIGENTKYLYKYIKYEIELAVDADLPIIAVNLNGKKEIDKERCPLSIDEALSLHIPFGEKELRLALEKWPSYHEAYSEKGDNKNYTLKDLDELNELVD
ncbi:TIR domain-containing protein [Fusobacterium sp. MFO224]|uniref:TIR domain-containing protein n=1 Tax=Fusobacterium sp. MFO224 TaxID=3378070 RepID=UPI003851F629